MKGWQKGGARPHLSLFASRLGLVAVLCVATLAAGSCAAGIDSTTSTASESQQATSATNGAQPDAEPASEVPDVESASAASVETAGQPMPVETDQTDGDIRATSEPDPTPPVPNKTANITDWFTRPSAPNGRSAPDVALNPIDLAAQLTAAEAALADPATEPAVAADWGHLHQVVIRKISYEPAWDVDFFTSLPSEIVERTVFHVSARRAFIELHSGYDSADFIPAWEIVEPEPLEELIGHYQKAEAATGVEWEYLAAINLVETGMGRIRGLSSAGAQGPMQFLATTWDEPGIGEGDIEDPGDAIAAAARYLVRRGGPSDMEGAIWGYNNSDNYVTAVQSYAAILRADPGAYRAMYHWEIYFYTEAGDVWLPTGFRSDEAVDLGGYLAANPWSQPDPALGPTNP